MSRVAGLPALLGALSIFPPLQLITHGRDEVTMEIGRIPNRPCLDPQPGRSRRRNGVGGGPG